MTPTAYRAGGANTEIRFAIGECSLGSILVAASNLGVCAILIGDDPDALARDLQDRFPRAHLIGGDAQFEQLVAQVVGFVEAPALGLDLPLDVRGTAFQQRVWQALREIPAGHYGELHADCQPHRRSEGGACGGWRDRRQPDRGSDPVSSRDPYRWLAMRLSLGGGTQARSHRTRSTPIAAELLRLRGGR